MATVASRVRRKAEVDECDVELDELANRARDRTSVERLTRAPASSVVPNRAADIVLRCCTSRTRTWTRPWHCCIPLENVAKELDLTGQSGPKWVWIGSTGPLIRGGNCLD